MTYQRKEELLSKDVLSVADVQELTGFNYGAAAELIRNVKIAMRSHMKVRGYVATGDYKRYMGISL